MHASRIPDRRGPGAPGAWRSIFGTTVMLPQWPRSRVSRHKEPGAADPSIVVGHGRGVQDAYNICIRFDRSGTIRYETASVYIGRSEGWWVSLPWAAHRRPPAAGCSNCGPPPRYVRCFRRGKIVNAPVLDTTQGTSTQAEDSTMLYL